MTVTLKWQLGSIVLVPHYDCVDKVIACTDARTYHLMMLAFCLHILQLIRYTFILVPAPSMCCMSDPWHSFPISFCLLLHPSLIFLCFCLSLACWGTATAQQTQLDRLYSAIAERLSSSRTWLPVASPQVPNFTLRHRA